MNYLDWEYHESKLPTDAEEKNKLLASLNETFTEQIKGDPAAQEWLNQYDETTINKFIEYYAGYKERIIRFSDSFIQNAERIPELAYREKTEELLELILQKKLFNQQCRWRAEQTTFPEVRVAYDFWYWERNVVNCPFLEPVTEQEIELMKRFLQTDMVEADDVIDRWINWQHHDEIMEKNEDGLFENMPDWYEYYDTYMGTGHLLLLPDVRGPKEEYYLNIARKREREEREKVSPSTPFVPPVRKEWLTYSYQQFYNFACVYDDAYFRSLMKPDMEKEQRENQLDEEEGDVERLVRTLKGIPDLPPVREGLSWRLALQRCYDDYVKAIIARDLSMVCEEYNLYRSMGISYETDKHTEKTVEEYSISNNAIERILRVRTSLGEPADLNF